jgi:hypothetical protein
MNGNFETMLRSDEKFCIDAIVALVGGKWVEGEDPPDAYLSIGNDNIAVEISTLTQYVTDHNGGSKPRLSEDSTALKLCNELDEQLKNRVPAGRTVLLILSAPINSARKLKPRLGEEIMALVESTGETDVTVEREILGNKITIHHFPEDRPSGKKIVGAVQNKESDTNILANSKAILADRIAVKAQKCKPLISSGPVWLALFNDYWLADFDTYKQAMAQISFKHPFERILIVSGSGSVTVLYDKHTKSLQPTQ